MFKVNERSNPRVQNNEHPNPEKVRVRDEFCESMKWVTANFGFRAHGTKVIVFEGSATKRDSLAEIGSGMSISAAQTNIILCGLSTWTKTAEISGPIIAPRLAPAAMTEKRRAA